MVCLSDANPKKIDGENPCTFFHCTIKKELQKTLEFSKKNGCLILFCFASDEATSSPTDATQNRADEGVVLLVKDQTSQPAAAQPLENPSPKVRILPPVETMLENEIWQYRYPPFDNLFDEKTNEDSDKAEAASSARLPRLNTDALPSYVIGILDPAELVDGLFQQRPFTFGLVRSQPNVFNKRNSGSNVDDAIKREGKGVAESSRKIFNVPRIIIDSTSDDDRWVWHN